MSYWFEKKITKNVLNKWTKSKKCYICILVAQHL